MSQKPLNWWEWIERFELDAHAILGIHEAAGGSRIVKLENTYNQLQLLNLKQDDLFRQALRCAENGLYRAAHVMCWAACMDFIQAKLGEDGLIAIKSAYPAWPRVQDVGELAEYIPERQLVEALKKVGLSTKNEVKALIGLLDRRNECAHPTDYLPELNETLGYISEVLKRIQIMNPKSLVTKP